MTRKELCELVLLEADNIKQYCTEEEISKLDIGTLNPEHVEKCIYGQMTGNCESSRSLNLIQDLPIFFNEIMQDSTKETLKNTTKNYRGNEFGKYVFSPIEVYISLPNANNKNLINYIKGINPVLKIK